MERVELTRTSRVNNRARARGWVFPQAWKGDAGEGTFTKDMAEEAFEVATLSSSMSFVVVVVVVVVIVLGIL